ncbi:amidase [Dongia sp.]|uniref:amidase n=1 Tax=Dongia sp. TaxID=1977262 RepID=UPI003751708A
MTSIPDRDSLNAFCEHVDIRIPGKPGGPLAGLGFAAKDIFDVAGHTCCCGNPDWLASHAPATRTAPVISRLVEAGATMVGKTITDELAYSLNGQNFHYGTPRNGGAPDRIPGGSSSGSVSAVANGAADFALGSDTGGSVRIPACLNGICGIRPTHGATDLSGVMPLAPSFDTVGWFARDSALLAKVGDVLLPEDRVPGPLGPGVLVPTDAWALADPEVRAVLWAALDRLVLPPRQEIDLAGPTGGLDAWRVTFRAIQMREIWAQHGAWIESRKPAFGPEIAERFALAKETAAKPDQGEVKLREEIRSLVDEYLANGAVMVIPTAADIAPLKTQTSAESLRFRDRTLSLTSISNLTGVPQIQIPVGRVHGAPVGLSFISARGSDRALLRFAADVAQRLS